MIALQHRFVDALGELTVPAIAAPAPAPDLLVLNVALAHELGLNLAELASPNGIDQLLGRSFPDGGQPVAMKYAGHQFGGYSPRLGDGRAMLLGEVATAAGLRDLHLKGSGPTGVGRGGDGLAAIGPMLREFLISEAMHALGIPTTRALAVIATGATVHREDGPHPGAVLVRTASSHIRVGTFQFVRAADDLDLLRRLVAHAVERHLPEATDAESPALALFAHVVEAQARLVAQWLSVGFVHGVMNTDNVTISGETIDYGPCAFLDAYSPEAVFSSIDTDGRYAFGNQPTIMQWNLARFAEALLPLVHDDEAEAVALLTPVLHDYPRHFNAAWLGAMARKLGLEAAANGDQTQTDLITALVTDLHSHLASSGVDFTSFFRSLTAVAAGAAESALSAPELAPWIERWLALAPDANLMGATNPLYIPRNHLVDSALHQAEAGDLTEFQALLAAVRAPYSPFEGGERFAQPAPEEFSATFRTYCGT